MELQDFVQQRVKEYYWEDDVNCATTTLKILSERFGIELSSQVIDSALGMHGAGKYGAQCGLVEGMLMFLGILGRAQNIPDDRIVEACRCFARQFEQQFSSLLCRDLRPEGFHSDNPPHLCETLTCDAVCFNIEFVQQVFCQT
ncbi:hypothetical protein U27_05014 [Candidatus Vecturithrix granuli]|uniref:C_GCAxxG_C_C family protein n=1 Tax=Vecturithrix granuli TaxID=1499967 RepID=A0A081C0D6_VECG1|nr:hypothetical protein U27_05014 [Candidatus Vecturithrix granuli]